MLLIIPACSSVALAAEYRPYDGSEVIEDVGADDCGIMPLSSHSITSYYGVGSSNVAIMEGLTSKFDFGNHYVYWRSGQYSYMLAHSRDLVYEGGRFSAPSVQLVEYNTYTGGSSQATWIQSTDSNFSLAAGNYLVWSDLGDYPQLESGRREREYVQTACLCMAVFFVFGLLNAIWRSIRGRESR